jgi:aspartate ammonia-lyase
MRKEIDNIGEMEIPDEALYGIHAARARENFPDTTRFHPEWYKAMGLVKKACYITAEEYEKALTEKFGELSPVTRHASRLTPHASRVTRHTSPVTPHLINASSEIAAGEHFDSFIVPAISGGAGTSINMNVNEIIANVALVSMGKKPGDYEFIDPIEQANIYQSTNDVVPTALKVATMFLLNDLETAINELRFVVEQCEASHQGDLRIGYTQMQEAVPSSFGKLFSTYSEALSRDWWRVSKCFERIKLVNLGGGATGSGMAVPRYFIMEAIGHLQQLTGLPVARSENLADATSNLDSFVEVHATLKAHAVNLEKMVSDLRLLASDITNARMHQCTNAPMHEGTTSPRHHITTAIALPQCQAGSSIMPGKVNPVIPEFVISSAHTIYANDQLISSLCGQGCLELNAYLPAIGHALLNSIKLLIACDRTLKKNLFGGLIINGDVTAEQLFRSPAITTALLPYTGYHKASELAREMKEKGVDVFTANETLKLLEEDKLKTILMPENLLKLGYTVSEIR